VTLIDEVSLTMNLCVSGRADGVMSQNEGWWWWL